MEHGEARITGVFHHISEEHLTVTSTSSQAGTTSGIWTPYMMESVAESMTGHRLTYRAQISHT